MRSGSHVTLRDRPVGGDLSAYVKSRVPGRGGRMILLVHGFNTTQEEARAGYVAFDELIGRVAPRLGASLCPVYWPGDSAMKGGAYPWLVARAAASGARLADWLGEIMAKRPGEVVIVAHSLGCRLTLEAIARLPDHLARRIRIFLMAAAVPVDVFDDQAEQSAEMRDALARATGRVLSADALYSPADGVLAFWFRLGQTAAPGEIGVLPEAVGLNGRPGRPVWSRIAEMPGYDHGQYWSGHRMVAHLAHRLGAAVTKPRPVRLAARPRLVPERSDPDARPGPPARRLLPRR
ncbi:MAG: alpha/beta hydrolase [Pseudomonadota bacterium]